MQRLASIAFSAACLAALAVLCVRCGGEKAPAVSTGPLVETARVRHLLREEPAADGPWVRHRLRLALPVEELKALLAEDRGRAEHLARRTAPTIVLSDDRDAFYVPGGTTLAFPIPDEACTLEVDLGVSTEDGAGLDEAEMRFDVALARTGPPLASERLPWVKGRSSRWVRLSVPIPERPSGSSGTRELLLRTTLLGSRAGNESDPAAARGAVGGAWANPCLVGSGDARRDPPPNVIVVSIDTLRADHLGAYGYERDTSPVLDALLARGALFEDAVSAAPWTLPSYGSFFTGRYPTEHRAGVKQVRDATWGGAACDAPFPAEDTENRLADALAADAVTMAEAFAAEGYRTVAFVNNPFLHASFGVDQGFGQYAWYQPRADGGVALALAWIEREKDRPFFLFLHLMDPHMPYVPPEPWATRYTERRIEDVPDYPFTRGDVNASPDRRAHTQLLVDLYDAEIAYTDRCLEPLVAELDATGLFERTIVVVHADHGEEFWEHGGFEHGHALNRETLHVPLGIVWPGRVPPVRVAERVRTIDVFPTLLDLVGLPPSAGGFDRPASADLAARSLLPHVAAALAKKPLDPRDAYAEALLYGPEDADYAPWNEAKAGWRAGLAVVVGGPAGTERLHDVGADPLEVNELAQARPDDAARMRALVERWHAELERRALSGGRATMTEAQREAMGDLGYTGEDAAVEDLPPPDRR